jgi:hypothetical protein
MSPHNHPIKTTLALALALGTIAPSAASARFAPPDPPGPGPNPPAAVSPAPAVQVVRVSAPGGFDWGDAGIGAAGGVALSMLGLGGALTVSQRRARRHNSPTALTS